MILLVVKWLIHYLSSNIKSASIKNLVNDGTICYYSIHNDGSSSTKTMDKIELLYNKNSLWWWGNISYCDHAVTWWSQCWRIESCIGEFYYETWFYDLQERILLTMMIDNINFFFQGIIFVIFACFCFTTSYVCFLLAINVNLGLSICTKKCISDFARFW